VERLTLRINGEVHEVLTEPHRTLLDVLRADLGLTGTKENCLEAECGVCTVLVDRMAVNSCILLAAECAGREITTIEGLGRGGDLHPLQQAFIDHGAVQCGYCIPGMILSPRRISTRTQRPRKPTSARRSPATSALHGLPEDRRGRPRRGRSDVVEAGEVVRGKEDDMTTTTRVVGRSLPRIDASGKVTGTAVYAADWALPGMLHGKIFRSTEAHARLVRIDPSRAAALPGVRASSPLTTHLTCYGGAVKDETVRPRQGALHRSAGGRRRRHDARYALAALEAIRVVYEPLTPVFDLEAALSPGAPLVHEARAEYAAIPILKRRQCLRARADRRRRCRAASRRPIASSSTGPDRWCTRATRARAAVAQWDSGGHDDLVEHPACSRSRTRSPRSSRSCRRRSA
jgi:aerobic-type carbon monoxide dehydrogenase small subunit (CoxS/CutS family)